MRLNYLWLCDLVPNPDVNLNAPCGNLLKFEIGRVLFLLLLSVFFLGFLLGRGGGGS